MKETEYIGEETDLEGIHFEENANKCSRTPLFPVWQR